MAQLHRQTQRFAENTRIPATPTIEQLLRENDVKSTPFAGEEVSRWSPASSSVLMDNEHDQEGYDHAHHQKKSVLTKVKERAIRLKHSLSYKKRHGEGDDGISTPPWGVNLEEDDEEEEDPEFLGAPMYESEMAPDRYKETLRQHPRADPVISEKHLLPNSPKLGSEHEEEKLHSLSPRKTMVETVNEMPAALKKLSMAETKTYPPFESSSPKLSTPKKTLSEIMAENPINSNKKLTRSMTEKLAPAYPISLRPQNTPSTPPAHSFRETPFSAPAILAARTRMHAGGNDQVWDKGVSVKEYLMHKFEPGEDEKALSQVISEAMSPRKTSSDVGVVEKMKEAVSSLLWTNEPPHSPTTHPTVNSPSYIPNSTNAHAGEEAKSVRTFRPH